MVRALNYTMEYDGNTWKHKIAKCCCKIHDKKSPPNPSKINLRWYQEPSWGWCGSPNRSKKVPEALLKTIWGPSLTKNGFWTPKKWPGAFRRSQHVVKFEVNCNIFSCFFRCRFPTNFAVNFQGSGPAKSGFRLGETLIFAKLTFSEKLPKITNLGTHFSKLN